MIVCIHKVFDKKQVYDNQSNKSIRQHKIEKHIQLMK